MTKLLDKYIKQPLLYDFVIVIIIVICKHILSYNNVLSLNIPLDTLKSMISDIISTTISLAGFILASLTIIVTFKDNINHKETYTKIEKKEDLTGMELLFTSKHYKRIVGVFSWACIIFLSIFFVISFLKLFLDKIITDYILDIIIITFIILSATIFRCLLILHSIIKIQIKSNITE